MALGALIRRGAQNTARFFNTTLPKATQQGVRFLNTHIVPFASRAHNVQRVISNEVASNEHLPAKVKEHAKKVSSFADLGMSRLTQVQGGVNRVAGQLGLT